FDRHPRPSDADRHIQRHRQGTVPPLESLLERAMPWMQRITWLGVAMHQGVLPGYPASHGCIRLPGSFAQYLFATTRMGARVIITRDDVAPFDIAHAKLFAPRPKPEEEPPGDQVQAKGALKVAESDDPVTT